jgi:hypothetical protein
LPSRVGEHEIHGVCKRYPVYDDLALRRCLQSGEEDRIAIGAYRGLVSLGSLVLIEL